MSTAELTSQSPHSGATAPPGRARRLVGFRTSEFATPSDLGSLLGVVAVAGPPVVPLVGGALLFGLMLWAPFVLFVALLIVPVLAAGLVFAAAGATLADVRLLFGAFRRRRLATVGPPPGRMIEGQVHHA